MKILYFSRSYTPHDHRFLSALAKTPHEVSFLQLEQLERRSEDRTVPEGVNVVRWDGGRGPFRWRDVPRLTADLKRIIDQIQPDVIHAGPVQSAAYLAARSGFQPLVTMSWGSDLLLDADRNDWMRQVTRYTLKRTTVLAGDCEAVRQKAGQFGFDRERVVLFPWGVDLERFTPGRADEFSAGLGWENAFVVLSLRSWEPLYGVDVLARGFARAAKQEPRLRLLMLSGGSQEKTIRQIFTQAGVLDRVHFAGQVSQNDLPLYYHAADLYVSASHSDGSSVSLMEALASGLPALVSDIPGNREWLEGSHAGRLFPDGDDQALADGISDVYHRRDELQLARAAARALAEQRANWKVNFQRLLHAYELAQTLSNAKQKGKRKIESREDNRRVVAIIQGRMSSSRLPGKILMDLGDEPMLVRVVERVRMAQSVGEVIVATTTDATDDPAAALCADRGIPCERGSLFDVLDRFYQAARAHHADVVVRVTADCPLIDPWVIDRTVREFYATGADFAANRLPPPWKRTYPIGLDVEVCSFAALETAWREAKKPHEREHVMPYLYSVPGRFKVHVVDAAEDYGHLRWTVDTPEDLEAVRGLYALLGGRTDRTWQEILQIWLAHPELDRINQTVSHKKFDDVDRNYKVSPH